MNSVLGVFCPFWSDEGPHFILPHFQGMMKSLGIDVQIIDLNIEAANVLKEEWSSLSNNRGGIWSKPQIVADYVEKSGIVDRLDKAIDTQEPSWLMFLSVNIASYQVVRFLIRHIRVRFSKKIRIAVGGPLCVGFEDSVSIFPEVDLVWRGTLESAIPILMRHYVKELDQDCPDYRFCLDFAGIDYAKYSKPQRLTYVLNYGCQFNCRYCHEGAQYAQEIRRSVVGLSNHLKTLLNALPTVKYIRFFDSSLNSNHGQFLDILDELDGKNLLWGCYLVPMPYIDRSFGLRMRSAGCIGVNIGVESGSVAVRKLMRKPTQLNVVESCIRELYAAGIYIHINLMVGYPGETEDDFNETLLFINRMSEFVSDIAVSITGIYAGTALFADAEKLGINLNGDIKNDFLFYHWALSDGSNTLSIRDERLLRVETHLASFGKKNALSPDAEDPGLRILENMFIITKGDLSICVE